LTYIESLIYRRIEKFNYLEITADRDYEPIVDEISKILDSIGGDMEEPMLISNRQIEAVSKARDALLIAREPLLNGELELFSYIFRIVSKLY